MAKNLSKKTRWILPGSSVGFVSWKALAPTVQKSQRLTPRKYEKCLLVICSEHPLMSRELLRKAPHQEALFGKMTAFHNFQSETRESKTWTLRLLGNGRAQLQLDSRGIDSWLGQSDRKWSKQPQHFWDHPRVTKVLDRYMSCFIIEPKYGETDRR